MSGQSSSRPGSRPASAGHGRTLTIANQRGLHARAAAKFAKTAGAFDADVSVSRCGQTVSGGSIMGLMMLAAGLGTEIRVEAAGAQADEALDALAQLVADKFGED